MFFTLYCRGMASHDEGEELNTCPEKWSVLCSTCLKGLQLRWLMASLRPRTRMLWLNLQECWCPLWCIVPVAQQETPSWSGVTAPCCQFELCVTRLTHLAFDVSYFGGSSLTAWMNVVYQTFELSLLSFSFRPLERWKTMISSSRVEGLMSFDPLAHWRRWNIKTRWKLYWWRLCSKMKAGAWRMFSPPYLLVCRIQCFVSPADSGSSTSCGHQAFTRSPLLEWYPCSHPAPCIVHPSIQDRLFFCLH